MLASELVHVILESEEGPRLPRPGEKQVHGRACSLGHSVNCLQPA
ncbi:rCG30401 [Rattus norvegicus]|uniref:RCG30401 n=1 Tax=Rattus norvegicus TaxID=10116 RepID=A6JFM9_RAT|nr:rCG30401 [Rattus norvegicus]